MSALAENRGEEGGDEGSNQGQAVVMLMCKFYCDFTNKNNNVDILWLRNQAAGAVLRQFAIRPHLSAAEEDY